ncbi:MAG: putative manganese-dependent inorganic diphosphatase [Solirubrobacterales bacterium]|nr:putative manganese-dependent inorganic diphosphatase [Solirubrobacterales bacterium]
MSTEAPPQRTRVYVTGHRNPDTDSIGSAIAYAELKNQLDDDREYVPVRLGVANAQTTWLLERSGAALPVLLPHAKLRVRDVMRKSFAIANRSDPVRTVGLLMAPKDVVPIVDDDGVLTGVLTERALARRYIRESREASRLDAPTLVSAIVSVLEGDLLCGSAQQEIRGRVWVQAMDSASASQVERGDVVVVGDRPDSQQRAIEAGTRLLALSNSTRPDAEIQKLAEEAGTAIVSSPLDSYVTSRMITLSEPVHAFVEGDPLTVGLDDLISDISEDIKTVHYRAAVAVDRAGKPIGLVTRSDLVNPPPRRVLLVDHAERAQSVHGIEDAEIVEILDHHHIGSIETKMPVTAIFDPVGSTATLVTERFRQAGKSPTKATAIMLLGAIMSDTVLLTSPTTTDRDHAATSWIEEIVDLDAEKFGREMFECSSDVSCVSAQDLVVRDLKEYELDSGRTMSIAQIETVGGALKDRHGELLEAVVAYRERHDQLLFALMVTDILERSSTLLVSGSEQVVERAFDKQVVDGVVDLPDVMSRKKQVAPVLMSAASNG